MHKLLLLTIITFKIFSMEDDSVKILQLPKGHTLKSEVIAALVKVQKELHKQELGLKITHQYKPLSYQVKKRPDRYWIDVRAIDKQGNLKKLGIPRGHFTDSPVGGDDMEAYNISLEHVKNREIMIASLKHHSFTLKDEIDWEYKDSKGRRMCLLLRERITEYGT